MIRQAAHQAAGTRGRIGRSAFVAVWFPVVFVMLGLCRLLVLLVTGILHRSDRYFEPALLIALFGFVSSAAMAKFLLRGEVIE